MRTSSALVLALVGAFRSARARRRCMDLDELDELTLRDLGISRSELSSFRAEVNGLAEKTRLRVLGPPMGGR